MSILSPTYNGDLRFSDIVEVVSHKWNCVFFEVDKLSRVQLESGMVDGTFEDCWPELFAEYYSETCTRPENIGDILYKYLAKYIKQDTDKQPRHIYMPSMTLGGRLDGRTVWTFSVWDEIQREDVFVMSFRFKMTESC